MENIVKNTGNATAKEKLKEFKEKLVWPLKNPIKLEPIVKPKTLPPKG